MIRNKPRSTVYGIDLGKNLFHVVELMRPEASSSARSSGARPF
jgi:hypothetical protein